MSNYFALEVAAIIVARRRKAENRERMEGGRELFPHVFIYFECQNNISFATYHDFEPRNTSSFETSSIVWPLVLFNALWLISLFAPMLICATLGIALVDM